jgi:type IV secretory pathway TraG/TraD family ATPase VirD4
MVNPEGIRLATTSQSYSPQNQLLNFATSQNGIVILVCLAILIVLHLSGNAGKKKIATGQFASNREKNKARSQAITQIEHPKRNSVALYIGRPKLLNTPPLYLPDAQRGTAICGGPGSGKTFSVIDPAVRSAIDQGFPIILYDFKYPSQTERIAGYAKQQGYQVKVFAPGFPESETCNPLDFLKDETDSLMARQMAEVLNRNFATNGSNKSEDPFFAQAGDQLTEGIFLLAKSFRQYGDLMMCQALLSLDKLPERLRSKADSLNPWIYTSFGQLISVGASEKTVASIIATSSSNFTRFMKKQILSAFCGQTTIPLDMQGRKLLILGLDRERRDVIGPLLATVLHMIVNRNVAKQRKDPLILCLDELPTLYLPSLVQWLNENREDGLVCLLGFQNLAQLEKTYGKELARSILGGCASKAIFNPQEYESAKIFSDFLGEEEISFKQKSKGRSGGKRNINFADQQRTRKLFEPSQFLKLPTGSCILINPGYRNSKEASIPIRQKIKLPTSELRLIDYSLKIWEKIRQHYVVQKKMRPNVTSEDLKHRYLIADQYFKSAPTQPNAAATDGSTNNNQTEQQPNTQQNQDLVTEDSYDIEKLAELLQDKQKHPNVWGFNDLN